ncbi:MAG TPA: hypothetical protein VGI39_18840 [Polyangiaceae bacterium]|jgi:hypothetical protein
MEREVNTNAELMNAHGTWACAHGQPSRCDVCRVAKDNQGNWYDFEPGAGRVKTREEIEAILDRGAEVEVWRRNLLRILRELAALHPEREDLRAEIARLEKRGP